MPTVRPIARYFGLAGPTHLPAGERSLSAVGRGSRHGAIVSLLATISSAATAVQALDWSTEHLIVRGALGILVWGGIQLGVNRHCPPREAPPSPAGEDTLPTPRHRSFLVALVLSVPLGAGATFVVHWLGLDAFFAPGQFAGHAVADGIVALRVTRWERRRGLRLYRVDGEPPRLVASPPT